jgi:hypothetical protein
VPQEPVPVAETYANLGSLGMSSSKSFGMLVRGYRGRASKIAVIARDPTPESQKRAFQGPRSLPESEEAEPYH